MTVKELLAFFEGYYGEKYTGLFLDTMTNYLEGCNEEFLSAVGKTMVLRFSRIYNKVPCPADIEKNMEEILTVMTSPVMLTEPQEERATQEEAEQYMQILRLMTNTGAGGKAMEKQLNNFVDAIGAA